METISVVTLILASSALIIGLISLVWMFVIKPIPPASTVLAIDEVSTTVPAKTNKNIVLHVSHPTGQAEVYIRGTKTPIHKDLTAMHVDGAIHTIIDGTIAPGISKNIDGTYESVYNPYSRDYAAKYFAFWQSIQAIQPLTPTYEYYNTWLYTTKPVKNTDDKHYYYTYVTNFTWTVAQTATSRVLSNPACTVKVNSSEVTFVTKGDDGFEMTTKRKILGKLLQAYKFSSVKSLGVTDITTEVKAGTLYESVFGGWGVNTVNNTIVLIFAGLLE